MRAKILILVFGGVFFILNAFAQENLVPNPSFEEFSDCPTGLSQVNKIVGWNSYNPTPDYYNSCADSISSVNIPNNPYGYQCASTGRAYCGLYTFIELAPNYREFIGAKLTAPLEKNQKYYITFKGSLAEGVNCATNNLGLLFSTVPYSDTIPLTINNSPHIYSSTIIEDSTNWFTISGSIIADSGYQYVVIGNFFDNNNTDTLLFDTTNCVSYYFIDDICVSTDSLSCVEFKRQIIDFNTDSITITKGSCINFNAISMVGYDFHNWQFEGAIPATDSSKNPTNICYDSVGSYKVTLIANDSSGCGDTVYKPKYITVQDVEYIDRLHALRSQIQILPNPATDYIYINNPTIYDEFPIIIYDSLGTKIYEALYTSSKIDLSHLSPNIYFIRIQILQQIIIKKIVLMN